jgi:prepilin-type N-terminal cleavage/methylation domain-containing protein
MFSMKKRTRFGFTLVEIMVAVTVLSVMTYVMWQVFLTFRRMNDVSTWQSARQMELKTAMKLIRTDLQEASYPAVITRNKSEFINEATHSLSYKDGSPFTIDSGTSGEYLKFYMCKPSKHVGDSRDSDGYIAECIVSFEGTNLRYVRTLSGVVNPGDPIDAIAIEPLNAILVHDVSSFSIAVNAGNASEAEMNFCTMAITCLHPNPKLISNVTERTGTKVEVAANPDL